MERTLLKKYARLIARSGANIQKGQDVVITAGLDQPDFVSILVEECYKAGATRVIVDFDLQPLQRLHIRYCSLKTLSTLTSFKKARWEYYVESLPCLIRLESNDPEGLKDLDQKKMTKAFQRLYPQIQSYREAMENKHQWCYAAVPGKEWAKKVFPELGNQDAVEKLWEAILSCCRVAANEDSVEVWKRHDEDLKARCAYLNGLGISQIHYTAENGTDLTVGMIPEAIFKGGGSSTLQGNSFYPNIPTEECFTSPARGIAEGKVVASLPLCWDGQIIKNFWIRFREGKAVEWSAEENEEHLTSIITRDEGAAYLGECAFVPYDSPIRKSGLLFYNTLFDENAVCHLALGRGFNDVIRGYESKTAEECRDLGINHSMIHADFMIGTEDMNIDAVTKNGKEVPLFRNGGWAF